MKPGDTVEVVDQNLKAYFGKRYLIMCLSPFNAPHKPFFLLGNDMKQIVATLYVGEKQIKLIEE